MNRVSFGVTLDGEPRVVRQTHPEHRPLELLQAELHWMHHLAQHGCEVAEPYLSRNGHLVESCDGWAVSVFRRATGVTVHPPFSRELLLAWGETIGRIHAAYDSYVPGPHRRWSWNTLPEVENCQVPVRRRLEARPQELMLVHNDLKPDNFLVHEGRLDLFDFDICCYCWPIQDLVVPLHFYYGYALRKVEGDPWQFWAGLLEGYRRVRPLQDDPELVNDLLLWREALIYEILNADRPHWQGVIDSYAEANLKFTELMEVMESRLARETVIIPR